MSAFLFVVLFVVLGLGTVLVAMRAGRKGPLFDPDKRSGRRGVAFLTLLTVVLFAVALPLATIIAGQDEPEEAGPVELTTAQVRGRELFSPTCSQCHQLDKSNAVGRVGPDLDTLQPNKDLVLNAIAQGRYNGRGQMPDRLFTGRDAQDVAEYVAAVAGR